MTYRQPRNKALLSATIALALLASDSLADTSLTTTDLDKCQTIAEMTPTDIYSKSMQGRISESDYNQAQSCFVQNSCSSLTTPDAITTTSDLCSAIALNSYLITVAYKTGGPAYPPYTPSQPSSTMPTQNNATTQAPTKAAPEKKAETETKTATEAEPQETQTYTQNPTTINW